VEADSEDVNALNNYATFLKDVMQQYDTVCAVPHTNAIRLHCLILHVQAKELFERALQIDAHHALTHYNYATLLHAVLKDYVKAEQHYELALKVCLYCGCVCTVRKC